MSRNLPACHLDLVYSEDHDYNGGEDPLAQLLQRHQPALQACKEILFLLSASLDAALEHKAVTLENKIFLQVVSS